MWCFPNSPDRGTPHSPAPDKSAQDPYSTEQRIGNVRREHVKSGSPRTAGPSSRGANEKTEAQGGISPRST